MTTTPPPPGLRAFCYRQCRNVPCLCRSVPEDGFYHDVFYVRFAGPRKIRRWLTTGLSYGNRFPLGHAIPCPDGNARQ